MPNAGGPPPGDFAHTTVDQYLDAFELNCRGAIAMCYEAVPAMRERKWGRVVAITSIAVRQPIPTLILSNTARAGLTGFLRTLAREVAADGVTVNSLLPGLHATERVAALHGGGRCLAAGIPAGFIGDPGRLRRASAAFVCSEHGALLTGTAIQVDGGAYGGAAVIRHVALLTFVDDATDAQVEAIADGAGDAARRIPETAAVHVRARPRDQRRQRDASPSSPTSTTVDDYIAYRDDPEHKRIIAELITPILVGAHGRAVRDLTAARRRVPPGVASEGADDASRVPASDNRRTGAATCAGCAFSAARCIARSTASPTKTRGGRPTVR